ncbi:substrate-binding domain-containing protein [Streptomyces sp. NPDC056660]|uniref:substrate-binding domain-containing protein n=1 Tax=Streptomyces sp. NPDC056660 TaxID=3345897 RepID=UPI0036D0D6C1
MTLGLVVPDLANPYLAEPAAALEDHAWAAGYTLLVGNSAGSAEREARCVQTFLDRQVDGLLLTPAHRGQPWHARLARTGVVLASAEVAPYNTNTLTRTTLDQDRFYGGGGAVDGLLDLSYRAGAIADGVRGSLVVGVDPSATPATSAS